jgi:hypothetical protein
MSRKNVIKTYKVSSSVDLSQASYTSPETDVTSVDVVSYQIQYTGFNSGTAKIEFEVSTWSSDNPNVDTRVWALLDLDPIGLDSATATGDVISVNIAQIGFDKIRFKYTELTAAAGTLNAWVGGKVVGA